MSYNEGSVINGLPVAEFYKQEQEKKEKHVGLDVFVETAEQFVNDINTRGCIDIILPINKICNLPVKVFLDVTATKVEFKIERQYAYNRKESGVEFLEIKTFNRENDTLTGTIINVLLWMHDNLSKYQVDKFTGKLIREDDENPERQPYHIQKNFAKIFACDCYPNCKFQYDFCCVCFDPTVSTTPCGHYLCIECEEQIPFDEKVEINNGDEDSEGDEENDAKYRKCPICRSNSLGNNY